MLLASSTSLTSSARRFSVIRLLISSTAWTDHPKAKTRLHLLDPESSRTALRRSSEFTSTSIYEYRVSFITFNLKVSFLHFRTYQRRFNKGSGPGQRRVSCASKSRLALKLNSNIFKAPLSSSRSSGFCFFWRRKSQTQKKNAPVELGRSLREFRTIYTY